MRIFSLSKLINIYLFIFVLFIIGMILNYLLQQRQQDDAFTPQKKPSSSSSSLSPKKEEVRWKICDIIGVVLKSAPPRLVTSSQTGKGT